MTTLVLVDTEAVGDSPVTGEMTEFGAVALNPARNGVRDSFHGLLVEAAPSPENPAIPFIEPGAKRYDTHAVMTRFHAWLTALDKRVVFVSDNPAYDWQWIAAEFARQGLTNPFGHSARRIGDFAAGLNRNFNDGNRWKKLRRTKHTHHPVDDAMGNAEALIALLQLAGHEKVVATNQKEKP